MTGRTVTKGRCLLLRVQFQEEFGILLRHEQFQPGAFFSFSYNPGVLDEEVESPLPVDFVPFFIFSVGGSGAVAIASTAGVGQDVEF